MLGGSGRRSWDQSVGGRGGVLCTSKQFNPVQQIALRETIAVFGCVELDWQLCYRWFVIGGGDRHCDASTLRCCGQYLTLDHRYLEARITISFEFVVIIVWLGLWPQESLISIRQKKLKISKQGNKHFCLLFEPLLLRAHDRTRPTDTDPGYCFHCGKVKVSH